MTAGLLKAAPEESLAQTVAVLNIVFESGRIFFFWRILDTWTITTLRMLPKKLRAIQATDSKPIASRRRFYKVFGYLFFSHVKQVLEAKQPEEQHGLRPGITVEEHLLTPNPLLDKAAAAGITVWVVSFDFSNALTSALPSKVDATAVCWAHLHFTICKYWP